MDEELKKKFKYCILFIVIAILLYAGLMNLGSVIKFFDWLLDITMPLVIGGMIAIVLNVPMRGLQNIFKIVSKKINKNIPESFTDISSLILTVVGTFLLIFLVFRVVVPQIIESISGIGDTFMNYYPKLLRTLQKYGIDTGSIDDLVDYLNIKAVLKQISSNAAAIVNTAFSAASSVFSTVFNIFTGFIIAIYILASKKKLKRQSKKLMYAYLKEHQADVICNVASLCDDTFFHFISGQCLEACILGMMFFVSMSIFRMPYAAVISLFIAFMALIPYIGAFLGMLVGLILIVMIDPMQALVFGIMFLIIQQIEGQLIYPRVVGSSVGLPAMWTMIAALIGGAMFGLVGMIFFIPLTSVVYSLLRDNINQMLKKKHIDVEQK